MATSYTISISEEQRCLILAALKSSHPTNVHEEGAALRDMFANLPQDEAQHPGVLHGFCL